MSVMKITGVMDRINISSSPLAVFVGEEKNTFDVVFADTVETVGRLANNEESLIGVFGQLHDVTLAGVKYNVQDILDVHALLKQYTDEESK